MSSRFYNGTSYSVRIYQNSGNGSFGAATPLSAFWPTQLMPADLDLDGDLDLVLCDLYRADVWTNDGGGALTHHYPLSMAIARDETSQEVSDIDGDGDLDLIYSDTESLRWHENSGGPRFDTVNFLSFDYGSGSVIPILMEDMDEDGLEDMLRPGGWQRNMGGGTFGPYLPSSIGDRMFAADLDGDGYKDVVSSSYTSTRWRRYSSQDTLLVAVPHALIAQGAMFRSFAADMDTDGDLDVITCNYTGLTVAWHPNTGYNSAQLPAVNTITSLVADLYTVEIGDLDSDGDPDIVYELESTNEVVWRANNGQGVFSAETILFATDEVTAIKLFDRDNDGDIDLAVGVLDYALGVMWIGMAENLGDGLFGPLNEEFPRARCPCIPVDMDFDGDIDLVHLSEHEHGLVWSQNDWTLSTSVGEKPSTLSDLGCYPMPFDAVTRVQPASPFAAGTRFLLVDAAGRTVRQGLVNTPDALMIQKQDLRPGLHTLLIVEPGKPNRTAKLVVE